MKDGIAKKSPKNGDIIKGIKYCRSYDLNRDSWKDLVRKMCSPIWIEERSHYIPLIQDKLIDRIRKGKCSEEEVLVYLHEILDKKEKRYIKTLIRNRNKSKNENITDKSVKEVLSVEEFDNIFN